MEGTKINCSKCVTSIKSTGQNIFMDKLWIPDIHMYYLKGLKKIGLIHDIGQSGGLTLS